MTNKKVTRKALLMSITSLLICISMLMGTTFAWFTDDVTSGVNKIVAGNLDVELYHQNAKVTEENVSVAGSTELFQTALGNSVLWEPGAMAYETFTIKNVGTLALKYKMLLTNAGNNTVKIHDSDTKRSLLDVLRVAVLDTLPQTIDRSNIISEVNNNWKTLKDYIASTELTGTIYPSGASVANESVESKTFTVVLYWPSDTETISALAGTDLKDNDYNLKNGAYASDSSESSVGQLFVKLGVTLVATQVEYEKDSFDENYDKELSYPNIPTYIHSTAKIAYNKNGETSNSDTSTDDGGLTTIPANTIITTDDNDINASANEYGTLDRNITTTPGTNSVTYDISFKYTTVVTTTVGDESISISKTGNVTSFSNIVTNTLNIGTGLTGVKVTHSHGGTQTEMAKLSSVDINEEGYYYDSDSGKLIIKSKTYSDFIVTYTGSEVKPIVIKSFKYDPDDATKLIGLGGYANDKVITIPENVKTIGGSVFANNTTVEEIILSSTVEAIEARNDNLKPWPFAGCENLKKVDMSKSKITTTKAKTDSEQNEAALFSELTSLETVILPTTLTEIYKSTFEDCINLKSIKIPASVTTIGSKAFYNSGITELNIKNINMSAIPQDAFLGMKDLEKVTLPENCTSIGMSAFNGCSKLTAIDLSNVTSIGNSAFKETGIKDVYVNSDEIPSFVYEGGNGTGHRLFGSNSDITINLHLNSNYNGNNNVSYTFGKNQAYTYTVNISTDYSESNP